jgi:hypothetical protein
VYWRAGRKKVMGEKMKKQKGNKSKELTWQIVKAFLKQCQENNKRQDELIKALLPQDKRPT